MVNFVHASIFDIKTNGVLPAAADKAEAKACARPEKQTDETQPTHPPDNTTPNRLGKKGGKRGIVKEN